MRARVLGGMIHECHGAICGIHVISEAISSSEGAEDAEEIAELRQPLGKNRAAFTIRSARRNVKTISIISIKRLQT